MNSDIEQILEKPIVKIQNASTPPTNLVRSNHETN